MTPTPIDDTPLILTVVHTVQMYVLPYLAYTLGIYIRSQTLPGPNAPRLRKLLLLGIPVYLLVVPPILMAAGQNLISLGYGYLVTIGIVMEQGMIVHETAVSRIDQALKHTTVPAPQAQPA